MIDMVSIHGLAKEFYYRHDFGSDDVGILRGKFPNTQFHNIPEAWIVVIDDMMNELVQFSQPTWVQQHFGFLSVQFKSPPTEDLREVIKLAERRLYRIDADLHKNLRESTGGNLV
jgi:hypothetical protein